MKYPDISHYHPVNDWAKAKANCGFLISKATQGTSYVDPTLGSFIKGCEAKKIPYWLYTFLNRGNEKAQTEFMVKTCRNKVGKYFMGYILDVEQKNNEANVQSALEYLKKQSKKTMLYTMYADYLRYKRVIAHRGENCAWWEARYGANNGKYSPKFPCHSGADLHQFTSNGSCGGISGRVDLNRLTGNKSYEWFTKPDEKAESKDENKSDDIEVDGSWGVETTKKAQKVFKTTVDGKISAQPWSNREYVLACSLQSWQFYVTPKWYKGGSELIKAIQRKLDKAGYYTGEIDGWCGKATIQGIQNLVKVNVTGKLDEKTVKAFQKWLNKQ